MCVAELWNFNGDSVDCWQLTDSLLAGAGDDLLCLNMENIQRRWRVFVVPEYGRIFSEGGSFVVPEYREYSTTM